jgi:hypothetical protein
VIKNLLCVFFLLISFSGSSQELSLFERFDQIPLSSKQDQVERFMAGFTDFKQSKITDNWAEIEYLGLEYKGPKDEDIVLLFYNGILYQKQLVLNYSLSDQNVAKNKYPDLKKYISSTNKILGTADEVISNEIYGSQIGEGTTYDLDRSSKTFKKKRAVLSAKLDIGYDDISRKPTAKFTGYKVSYEALDLSKTELDPETGFKSYQL